MKEKKKKGERPERRFCHERSEEEWKDKSYRSEACIGPRES